MRRRILVGNLDDFCEEARAIIFFATSFAAKCDCINTFGGIGIAELPLPT